MDIGKLINYHRKQQNLSMNELARRATIAQSGLSDIEAGKRQPTFDLLEKIVNALNLTWSDFLNEDKPNIPPDIQELIKLASTLPDNQIQLLSSIAKEFNKSVD